MEDSREHSGETPVATDIPEHYRKAGVTKLMKKVSEVHGVLKSADGLPTYDYVPGKYDDTFSDPPTAVSLFCGCGGLDYGFATKGFKILAAFDYWGPAVETYNTNFKRSFGATHEARIADVRCMKPENVPACDLMMGGFPCVGFSNAGGTIKTKEEKKKLGFDPRNLLAWEMIRLVKARRPKIVVAENVLGLRSKEAPDGELFIDKICREFDDAGYAVSWEVLKLKDYGVPSDRVRLIFLADRVGLTLTMPPKPKFDEASLSMRNIIGDFPDPDSPEGKKVPDHEYKPFSPSDSSVISLIPPGGTWKDIDYEKLPLRLKKIRDNMRRYHAAGMYQRREWDRIAGTMSATMNPTHSHSIHPDGKRRFTVREASTFQSFPPDFVFKGNVSEKYRLVGNAVPPKFAEILAGHVMGKIKMAGLL